MGQRRLTARVQVVVEPRDFRHTAHPNPVTQPGDRNLEGLVHHGRHRSPVSVHNRHGDRIALHRIDRQAHAKGPRQDGRIAAHSQHKRITRDAPRTGLHAGDPAQIGVHRLDLGVPAKDHAQLGRHFGQPIGELKAIARLIARQTQTARDLVDIRGQTRLGPHASLGVQHFERHTIGLQNLDVLFRRLNLLCGAKQLQRALRPLVIRNASVTTQLNQAIARIFRQTHHAGFVHPIGRTRAVHQHPRHPFDLGQIGTRTNDQRCMLHEQPLHRFGRNAGGRPRAGITGANFARIGKRGLQRRAGLAVNHRHLMALFCQVIGRGDTNDTSTKDDDTHGMLLFAGLGRKIAHPAERIWRF